MVVSIVMINRNGGAALQRAIATCRIAIEQALSVEPRIEFVIVDNGSTDSPEVHIERELRTAAFAWRIVHEPRAGINYARNAGIEQSVGDLLFFVDSDLEFDPGWLARSWQRLQITRRLEYLAGRSGSDNWGVRRRHGWR